MIRYFPALFLLFLLSCDPPKQQAETKEKAPAVDANLLVSCEGIGKIKLADTYADLEKRIGAQALSAHENSVIGKYTTAWDGTPKQINIYWKEKSPPFKHIKYIETTADDAPYVTQSGLQAGMSLKDIQQLNSFMPVSFVNPYATENAGLITGFNNGDIAKTDPCIGGHIEIRKQRNIDIGELNEFKKEKLVDSSHKLMAERMECVLATIRITGK